MSSSYHVLSDLFDKAKAVDAEAVPVKMWTRGVPVDEGSKQQLLNTAQLPFIFKWLAVMPDVHFGKGSTIGSVIPTKGAIIPAAVGVDLGCGMMATRTSLTAKDLPDGVAKLRLAIEAATPHGGAGAKGGWRAAIPSSVSARFSRASGARGSLAERLDRIIAKHPAIGDANSVVHLGTLGGGNHFIEICLDEVDRVWVMLHSGSRGIGNRIGTYFIEKAREKLSHRNIGRNLPDRDLAWLEEGEPEFDDYIEAVLWAQDFARANREVMMERTLAAMRALLPPFKLDKQAVNCHHNYVEREVHFGERIWVTRKGAVRAGEGDLGIIPGSMGAKSFIVRGKGNLDSFCSCSHGAGRVLSRTKARELFSVEDHVRDTQGIECRKDAAVIDETPRAYKNIDAVMAAQADLVEIVHTLRQIICVKG